ncbi:MAG: hypothetical protein QMD04_07600 [Anaerolineales bacterium]|nr:hypothetical protein [Anaerolineales bacterium]
MSSEPKRGKAAPASLSRGELDLSKSTEAKFFRGVATSLSARVAQNERSLDNPKLLILLAILLFLSACSLERQISAQEVEELFNTPMPTLTWTPTETPVPSSITLPTLPPTQLPTLPPSETPTPDEVLAPAVFTPERPLAELIPADYPYNRERLIKLMEEQFQGKGLIKEKGSYSSRFAHFHGGFLESAESVV